MNSDTVASIIANEWAHKAREGGKEQRLAVNYVKTDAKYLQSRSDE